MVFAMDRDALNEKKLARMEEKEAKKEAKLAAKLQKQEEKQAALDAIEMERKAISRVLITTSDINVDYEIIDSIFAIASSKLRDGADPAFIGVKKSLKQQCYQLGGQAVICCQFDYRTALDSRDNGVLEIFAYGTAVRIK